MYNSYDSDKVLRTTPKKSLEDSLLDTTYSFLSNSIHYAVPVAAGLMIGSGILSENKSIAAGVVTAACSGYIQYFNYINDFNHSIGDSEISDGLKDELRLRGAIGVLRGVIEGGVLLVASDYAATYFQRACDLVK